MTNELLKKYIGKNCFVSTGSFGGSFIGVILEVNENWLEIETKKGNQIVNTEYIQSIKEMQVKK
ncbi:MAG: hypothetical protein K0Q49_2454 [Haloplasmataceae bacterium]|nr:hypothetical protein [Haloplasmataceae bacterium]